MKRRTMLVGIVAMVASVFATPAMAAFPEKPVTVICPWAPGGGTVSSSARFIKEAEKFLGQPITVVNQTGGAGGDSLTPSAQPGPTDTPSG